MYAIAGLAARLHCLIKAVTLRIVDPATGSRIKQARDAKGWSQMDLGEQVGVSLRTIGTWEKTGRVPMERRQRLADALAVDVFSADGEDAVAPSEINWRGWKFTFTPAPDATPAQVSRAEAAVLETVWLKLRELGLEDPQ